MATISSFDFNVADYTSIGTATGGAFSRHPLPSGGPDIGVYGNKLVSGGVGTGRSYFFDSTDPGTADYAVQISVIISEGVEAVGVCARGSTTELTFYWLRYYNNGTGRVQLHKWIAGANTLLGTYEYTPSGNFTLRIECSGTTIRALIDGAQVISATDSSISAAGRGMLFIEKYGGLTPGIDNYFSETLAAAGVTGTLSATEGQDILAASATFTGVGTLSATEGSDVASFTGVFVANTTGTFSATEGADTFAATASFGVSTTGTITTSPLIDAQGNLRINETGVVVYVYDVTSGALVVKKTGQTTNSSGVCSVTDSLIVPATAYRTRIVLSDGTDDLPQDTAT